MQTGAPPVFQLHEYMLDEGVGGAVGGGVGTSGGGVGAHGAGVGDGWSPATTRQD